MFTIKLHFPRCSGHEKKNRLISSIVYRLAGKFDLKDKDVRVLFYESEFRSDIVSNLGDFVHIDVIANPEISSLEKSELAAILKDEVSVFSGTKLDDVSIYIINADRDSYYGR